MAKQAPQQAQPSQPAPQTAEAPPAKGSNKKAIIIVVILGICLLCTGLGVGGYFALKDKVDDWIEELRGVAEEVKEEVADDSDSDSDSDTEEEDEEELTGTVTGALGFPSDYIPEDMLVCAEDIVTHADVACTSEQIPSAGGASYNLEVPAGTYYIYAYTSDLGGDSAYYTEAVECGLTIECTDHTPIEVVVGAGETVTGIDPIDWYGMVQ